MIAITGEEWLAISRELEQHHALFYQLWQLGKPIFDPNIPTAEVRFNPEGECVEFVFSPDFWNKLSVYERLFIICHECLHVIFNHGLRGMDTPHHDLANIAMDLVVNHTLVRGFGFLRNQLTIDKNLCWIDTVFPNQNIPDNESFEFYYKTLQKIPPPEMIGNISGDSGNPSGNHEGLEGLSEQWDDLIKDLNEKLGPQEKKGIQDILEKHTQGEEGSLGGTLAGTGSLGKWEFVKVGEVKRKKKWETVIQQWSKKYLKTDFQSIEQWARLNRRLSILDSSLFLPSEMEMETLEEDRIRVWFFQDCSGSCWHLKDRFFKAALSLDPKRFDVKAHTFDTKVFEVDLKQNKVRGGGGTRFSIIEKYIQDQCQRNNESYPEAIFLITDGLGNRVTPEQPKKWYWFLTQINQWVVNSYLPKESNIYNLKDFE